MKKITTLLLIILAATPLFVDASGIKNPIGVKSIEDFIYKLIDIIVQFGVIIVVLGVIYSGFLFVTARGNPEKLTRAKTALMWVIIGGLVLLGARTIADVIQDTAGKLKSGLPVTMPMIGYIYNYKLKNKK